MNKKLIAIILTISLLFGLVGCTSAKEEEPISRQSYLWELL